MLAPRVYDPFQLCNHLWHTSERSWPIPCLLGWPEWLLAVRSLRTPKRKPFNPKPQSTHGRHQNPNPKAQKPAILNTGFRYLVCHHYSYFASIQSLGTTLFTVWGFRVLDLKL